MRNVGQVVHFLRNKYLAMRDISGKNMELWKKNGDCIRLRRMDYPHFSEHHNVISDG